MHSDLRGSGYTGQLIWLPKDRMVQNMGGKGESRGGKEDMPLVYPRQPTYALHPDSYPSTEQLYSPAMTV